MTARFERKMGKKAPDLMGMGAFFLWLSILLATLEGLP